MHRIAAVLLTLTTLLLLPAAGAAQEEDETNSWSAEAGLTLQASGGNESLTVFTVTGGLSHLETDVYEASGNVRFRYGESEGVRVVENLRGEASMDLWPGATWSPFFFATGEQDPIKKLEARLNGGAGAKRTFWQDGWNEVSTSAAVLYSYENLDVADSLGTGVTQTARWSLRLRGRTELGTGSRFEQVIFFQPAWDRIRDYQLESVTKLRVALSEQLSITTDLLYQRDNTPAPDVKP
ncbi:MAG: DUF481 domain-containing protein, partial [Longimicrobiales bacterium]|nr:DUF481 domain-containing protein [Longimicrobiales bacterium]